jgi:hypothetical protein
VSLVSYRQRTCKQKPKKCEQCGANLKMRAQGAHRRQPVRHAAPDRQHHGVEAP